MLGWVRVLARLWIIMLASVVVILIGGLIARWLAPLGPWAATPTVQLRDPLPQSVAVPPRSAITLAFSEPMNPITVARSIRIEPALAGALEWEADYRVVRFVPTQSLQPATTYRVLVTADAQSRWWKPLAAPALFEFTTAAQPTVIAALPPRQLDAPIALIFSQPMVAAETVGQPAALDIARLSPAWPLNGQWLDQRTLLLQPVRPFTAATTYTLTLAAELTDLRGIEAGKPFEWQFATPWPKLIELSPSPDARWVNPSQALTLILNAPIDTRLLSSALDIIPATSGAFSSAFQDGRYVVTFQPHDGWVPGQTYQIRLQPPDADPVSWQFHVEPEPALIAASPGQGQTLAPGQEIRLIFSTPMDEAGLRAGIRFEPPVADFELLVDETQARIRPVLQAATTYTLTIAAGTPDRSGARLRDEIRLNVRATSAPPSLRIPGETLLYFAPDTPVAVTLERVNVPSIDAQLYRLDATTVLRALLLRPAEWPGFVPERYAQPLMRAWREALSDPPDVTVQSLMPITANSAGDPLAPGAYYLRLTTSVGPRVDRLLLISPLRISHTMRDREIIFWVTSSGSGLPAANVPLTLYAGETLLARGVSNEQGVWRVTLPTTGAGAISLRAASDLIVVAEGNEPGLLRMKMPDIAPAVQALLALDRASYRPGGIVRVSGLVRERQPDGRLAMPSISACALALQGAEGVSELSGVSCAIDEQGQLTGSARLAALAAPGSYTLRVTIGDSQQTLPLQISVPSAGAVARVTPARPSGLHVDVTQNELPVSGAVARWSLRLIALTRIDLDGSDGEPLGPASESQGSAITDQSGRVTIGLPASENLLRPLRYEAEITVTLPSGEQLQQTASGIITPRSPRLIIDAPALIDRNERAIVTIRAQDGEGQPLADTIVTLDARRSANEPPVLSRRIRTDRAGQATIQLVTLAPGRYELVAQTSNSLTRTSIWVAGASIVTAEPQLIIDRAVYRRGDVARLMISGPTGGGTTLLVIGQGDALRTELLNARPGVIFTLPISDTDAPITTITALIDDGVRVWSASATVQIDPPPNPILTLSQREFLPGSTATLTVTAAADQALVLLAPEHTPPIDLRRWASNVQPFGALAGIVAPATTVTNDDQPALTIPLPNQPGRWRIDVITLDPTGRAAVASATLSTNQPIEVVAAPLPALRPGDTAVATLIARNVDEQARSIRARLWLSGGVLLTPLEQEAIIPARSTVTLAWTLQPQAQAQIVGLRYEVIVQRALPPIEYAIPVLRERSPPATTQTRVSAQPIELTLPAGEHDVAVAASARAALGDQAQRLLQQPAPTAEMLAAALIISNELARTAAIDADARFWRDQASNAARQLRSLRNPDGGWGWWPNQHSDPFVTAFALEALGRFAQPAADISALIDAAQRYLRQVYGRQPADLQAYIDYVMSLTGTRSIGSPAQTGLGAAGRAFTALRQSDRRQEILRPFWSITDSDLPWAGASGLPPSALAVSASVVQALTLDRPTEPRLSAWRAALLRRWQVDGWPTPYEAARVALALGSSLLMAESQTRALHNGEPLNPDRPIEQVERFRLPGGTLRIEPGNSAALVAARSPATQAESPSADLRLRMRLLNDAEPLTIDQPAQIEVLLLARKPLFRLDTTISLPAGLIPVAGVTDGRFPYLLLDRERRQARIGGIHVAAGVYRLIITAMPTTAGSFQFPPALAIAPGSDLAPVISNQMEPIEIAERASGE